MVTIIADGVIWAAFIGGGVLWVATLGIAGSKLYRYVNARRHNDGLAGYATVLAVVILAFGGSALVWLWWMAIGIRKLGRAARRWSRRPA